MCVCVCVYMCISIYNAHVNYDTCFSLLNSYRLSHLYSDYVSCKIYSIEYNIKTS